ncbi:ATP-binding protein [Methanoculleus sp.]|uniref:ATP-binding protein n=1 Tax=Methanoculleus sp. TaxID=90427 RepID=UPI001BD413B0
MELLRLQEHSRIEAKRASEVGKELFKTISAFSNEPGLRGGYILLGVIEEANRGKRSYKVEGVKDLDKVQSDLATQCATVFNTPVRPEIHVGEIEGKKIVCLFIPESEPEAKPIYIRAAGVPRGAYRRIGSTDHKCTDEDIELFYQERSRQKFDQMYVNEATYDDIDPDAVLEYRKIRSRVNSNAEELALDDVGILKSLHCIKEKDGRLTPTVAGLILFGKREALKKYLPLIRVDYIRIPGLDWVEHSDSSFDSLIYQEALIPLIPKLHRSIMSALPTAVTLKAGQLQRQEAAKIPDRALREALVNALMHRNYRSNKPIQIIHYNNRLEITNPGYSLVPVENLGEPGSYPRNPKIADILHDLNYAEIKGRGIALMRKLMEEANLSPPKFNSDRDRDLFHITLLFHHFLAESDINWLTPFKDLHLRDPEVIILHTCKNSGRITNKRCRELTGLDTNQASSLLKRLRNIGLLSSCGKGCATYYTPSEKLLGLEKENVPVVPSQKLLFEFDKANNPHARLQQLEREYLDLLQEISSLKQREISTTIADLIVKICSIKPHTAKELSEIFNRTRIWMLRKFINPLLEEGRLQRKFSDPNNPNQAYIAGDIKK